MSKILNDISEGLMRGSDLLWELLGPSLLIIGGALVLMLATIR